MFVVETAGLEAVVELTEEFVERASLCMLVPVTRGAASVEVVSRSGRSPERPHGPDGADNGQAPVFDLAVQDHRFLAAGPGGGCGPGEGLQPAGIGEALAVVPGLAEPGAGQRTQTGKLVVVASGCPSQCALAASADFSAAVHAA